MGCKFSFFYNHHCNQGIYILALSFHLPDLCVPFACDAEQRNESTPDGPVMQIDAGSMNQGNWFLPSMDHIKQENCLMIWKQL